ncbi:MAG: FHA domain-containing protein [Streptosporangiales bacterium]|nr:FHA domain-containing protein [Streptosporangiales bacterium]
MGNDPSQDTLWSIPGDGVLARQGDLVLLISIEDRGFTESLLDLLARVSKDGGDGRVLADAIGAQVEGHHSWGGPAAGPSVVSFGPSRSGMAFGVSGTACVDLTTSHGDLRLTAEHPSMLLRSTVGTPVQSIRAALDRDEPGERTDRFSRLDSGSVRAGGLSFYAAPPAQAAPAPGTGPQPVPGQAGPGAEATGPRPTQPAAGETGPGPVLHGPGPGDPGTDESGFSPSTLVGMVLTSPGTGPGPAAVGGPNADAPVVLGVYCDNGHFTDPDAQTCVTCGAFLTERAGAPQPGPRPPLGLLVLDNGAALAVDGDYVIGRDPAQDPTVAAGTARPLRVTDAQSTVSRIHARIHVDGWQVRLIDLGAANGTHIHPRDSQMPLLLEPHVPVPIQHGARIFVGAPCLRFEQAGG